MSAPHPSGPDHQPPGDGVPGHSGAPRPLVPRIFVVDDSPHLLGWISKWIAARVDLVQLAGTASTIAEARARVAEASPDLILLDFRLGSESAPTYIRELRALGRRPYVVVHTGHINRSTIQTSLAAGAQGIIGKDADPDELLALLLRAANGDVVFSRTVRRVIADSNPADSPWAGPGGH